MLLPCNCQKGDKCDFAHGTATAAPASGGTTLSMEDQADAQHSDHEDDMDGDMQYFYEGCVMELDAPMGIDIQPHTALPGYDLLTVNHNGEDGQAPVTSVVVATIAGVSPAIASSDGNLQINGHGCAQWCQMRGLLQRQARPGQLREAGSGCPSEPVGSVTTT